MLIEPKTQHPPHTGLHCADCGTRNTADSKYCKECGAKIHEGLHTVTLSEADRAAVPQPSGQERLAKLLDMAFWHNEAGNWDAAILACEAALVVHPHCTTAHSLLGSLYEKKGDNDKAALHFETVVALNPESAADQTKLEQVRRGIHMKPVAPPPQSRWLPPVLNDLSERLALSGSPFGANRLAAPALADPDNDADPVARRVVRLNPLVASAAVTALVLMGGLLLVRPLSAPRRAAPLLTPVPVRSAAASAFGAQAASGPEDARPPASSAPIVLQGGASTPIKTAPLPVLPANADPFTETVKPGDVLQPVVRAPRPARLAHRTGGSLILPPLSLRAVPLPDTENSVAPAPVSFPAGGGVPVTASVASVPQHTVVVSHLGGPSSGTQPASFAPSGGSDTGGPAAHIRISIHASPGGDTLSLSNQTAPDTRASAASSGADSDGDRYQQSALALQQQGDFRHARAVYEKAIRAYQAQIAAGRDPQTASAGLQACQTGLQICQQSAP